MPSSPRIIYFDVQKFPYLSKIYISAINIQRTENHKWDKAAFNHILNWTGRGWTKFELFFENVDLVLYSINKANCQREELDLNGVGEGVPYMSKLFRGDSWWLWFTNKGPTLICWILMTTTAMTMMIWWKNTKSFYI